MIDVLFVALVAVAIYNPTLPLWILVSMVVVSDALFGAVDGWVYFGLMALIDLLCVIALSSLPYCSRQCVMLIIISILSIVANIVGWLLWYTYQPADFYVNIMVILYIITIIVGLANDRIDGVYTRIYRNITARHLSNDKGGA